jgi:hypothetical protein
MIRLLAATLLTLGAVPVLAQEPTLWRDPAQGCTYLVTPQGGVTLRYRRDGLPDCTDARPSPSAGLSAPAPAMEPRAAIAAPAAREVQPAAPALMAPGSMAFNCQGGDPQGAGAGMVRVRIEPGSRAIVVDAAGAAPQRYTLDSVGDVWFNGRSERDPRLGIILSPSSGSMWLDTMAGEVNQRFVAQAQPFRCRAEGAMY